MAELFSGYCIDTSSLIDLWQPYPDNLFPDLRPRIEDFIHQGRLIAPSDVLKELERRVGDDELLNWAREQKMFVKPDHEQSKHLSKILTRFPRLVEVYKGSADADPMLVALAMSKGPDWAVITQETPSGSLASPKIPDVCKYYKLKPLSLFDFFSEQNWEFVIRIKSQ